MRIFLFVRLFLLFCSSCLVKTIYLIKWRQAHNYIVHFLSSMVNTQNMNCLFWLHEMHILISQFIRSLYAYEDTVVFLCLFARIIGCDFAFRQFHDKFKIVLIQLKCLYRWNNHFNRTIESVENIFGWESLKLFTHLLHPLVRSMANNLKFSNWILIRSFISLNFDDQPTIPLSYLVCVWFFFVTDTIDWRFRHSQRW